MKKPLLLLTLLSLSTALHAGPRDQAWKLHNRLAGVPPMPRLINGVMVDVHTEMERSIAAGKADEAAAMAATHPGFINTVLKNWIKPWTNRDQTSRVDLNDYVATVLGVIRDDVPFDQVLYGDLLYTVDGGTLPYSNMDNNHYQEAETSRSNLTATLRRQVQSQMSGLPVEAVAGVITTRAGGEAFFQAGTNRRVNRFTFMNYLCKDYEQLHDTTVPDYRVRRDVERDAGGDSRTYKNNCVGCHAGQDALGGAWAYHDYDGTKVVYTPGAVVAKVNQNAKNYPNGYVSMNDSWINLWATGQNSSLGWKGAVSGNGGKSINEMFSHTRAFASCMSNKVFQLVCLKKATSANDKATVESAANVFERNGEYNMKKLILRTSAGCVVNE